jgi:competence protein ComEC
MRYLLSITLGIFCVSYLPALPRFISLIFLFACALLALTYRRWLLLLFLIGVYYGVAYGYYIVNQQLPVALDDHIFIVKGEVVGLPQYADTSQRFHFRVDTITALDANDQPLANELPSKKIALSWYQTRNKKNQSNTVLVNTGELWQFTVKLRRPRGFVNPAGFDYHLYLLQQKIMATGYVRDAASNQRIVTKCKVWLPNCWRASLRDSMANRLQESSVQGPLMGLLIGDRQLMSAQQWQLLRDTGTIHLLAISGLHVGLAASLGFLVGRFLYRLWQIFYPCRQRFYYFPSLLSIVFAVVYGLLAGFSLPTQRALIMVAVFHFLVILYRRVSPWLLLTLALFFIALLDPLSIRSQGFCLSFLAVAILLFIFSGYLVNTMGEYLWPKKIAQVLKGFLKAQWGIGIGLLLPGIVLLQGLSLSAPLANIVAIPLVSIITVPALLLATVVLPISVLLSDFFLRIAELSLRYLFFLLEKIEAILGGFWYFNYPQPSYLSLLLASLGVLWLLMPKGIYYRYLAVFCFLPLFFPLRDTPALRVTFLDVGQGTAVAVETPKHRLVYDAGRQFSERFNGGEHIVAPYLLQQGYNTIDRLLISHSDMDHAGGVSGLLSIITATDIMAGEPKRTLGRQCYAGQTWQWDQVHFSVLWPTLTFLEQVGQGSGNNNYSCVLLIRYGETSFLLTGDIEAAVEKQLLQDNSAPTNVAVLLIPHHGSRTSSSGEWVRSLAPRYAIATAGFHNPYGHPRADVLQRYYQIDSHILHTGQQGALRFTVLNENGDLQIERWRTDYSRYWFD